MANRRRRNPSDMVSDEPPDFTTDNSEGSPGLDPDIPPQMAFFRRMREIASNEWHHRLYLYRLVPRVNNANGPSNIGTFDGPIDEKDIIDEHGGGKYQLILNDITTDKTVAKCIFTVGGTPKLLAGQTFAENGNAGVVLPAGGAQSASPSQPINERTLADVVSQAITAVTQNKMPADEAIKSAMNTLAQAQKGAMEIVMSTAKAQATPRDPMADVRSMLDTMKSLQSLTGENEKRNPVVEMREMLSTVRELQGLTGESAPRTSSSSLVENARALAEIAKADGGSEIVSKILGIGEDAEPAGAWGTIGKFGMAVIEKRPDVVDSVAGILSGLARRLMTPASGYVPQPQPTLAGVPAAPAPVPAPSQVVEAPAQPAQVPQEVSLIDVILSIVRKGFENGADGSAVTHSIETIYPEAMPKLVEMLKGFPDAQVFMWLRTQPAIASVVDHQEFPEFYAEFKQALLEPEQPEESEQGSAGTTSSESL